MTIVICAAGSDLRSYRFMAFLSAQLFLSRTFLRFGQCIVVDSLCKVSCKLRHFLYLRIL
jgi:hypothetical protein